MRIFLGKNIHPEFNTEDQMHYYLKEDVDKMIEKLYNLNADISLASATEKNEDVKRALISINESLGKIIKEMRG